MLIVTMSGVWWFLGRPISAWIIGLMLGSFVLLGLLAPWLPQWFTGVLHAAPVRMILMAVRILVVLVPPVLLVMGATLFARHVGATTGYQAFSKTMWQVRLSAEKPLMPDVPAVVTPGTPGNELLVYDTLYLLTFNEGRYFLFQSVNAACQPEKVYVVQEAQLRTVEYTFAPPPQPSCATNHPNKPASATPLPVVTPAPPSPPTPTP